MLLFLCLFLAIPAAISTKRGQRLTAADAKNSPFPDYHIWFNYKKSLPISPLSINKVLWIDNPGALKILEVDKNLPAWLCDGAIQFIKEGYTIIREGVSPELW
jgi:hypothetical protein